MKTIGAVVITYHTPQKQLSTLQRQLSKIVSGNRTVIIDNTSNNRGYGVAANEGIVQLYNKHTDIYIILNPDVDISQVTKKVILETSNKFDIFGFPFKEKKRIYYGGYLDKRNMAGSFLMRRTKKLYEATQFVSGSCIGMNKKIIDDGILFDPTYFLYYEDVDLCVRAAKQGHSVGIRTDLQYTHTGGSIKEKEYYSTRNRLLLLFRYGLFSQKLHEVFASIKHCSTNINKYKFRAFVDFLKLFLFNYNVQY